MTINQDLNSSTASPHAPEALTSIAAILDISTDHSFIDALRNEDPEALKKEAFSLFSGPNSTARDRELYNLFTSGVAWGTITNVNIKHEDPDGTHLHGEEKRRKLLKILENSLRHQIEAFWEDYAEDLREQVSMLFDKSKSLEERAEIYSEIHTKLFEDMRVSGHFDHLSDTQIHDMIEEKILEYAKETLVTAHPEYANDPLKLENLAKEELLKVRKYLQEHPEANNSITAQHFLGWMSREIDPEAAPSKLTEIKSAADEIKTEMLKIHKQAKEIITNIPNESLRNSALSALKNGNMEALHEHIRTALDFLESESPDNELIEDLKKIEPNLAKLSTMEAGYSQIVEHLQSELKILKDESETFQKNEAGELMTLYSQNEIARMEELLNDLCPSLYKDQEHTLSESGAPANTLAHTFENASKGSSNEQAPQIPPETLTRAPQSVPMGKT